MNMALLHRKVLGMPVWAVGAGGGLAFVLYHYLHKSGVGGAQADTTPASGTGDASYGDPVPADAGTFPQTYPSGNGSTPSVGDGSGSGSGADLTGIGDALTSLGELFANQAPPPDYSSNFNDLNTTLGTIRDQEATDHAQAMEASAAAKTHSKVTATKAATVHAKSQAHGGHAVIVKKAVHKAAPAKPATHTAKTLTHPKAPAKAPKKGSQAHRAL